MVHLLATNSFCYKICWILEGIYTSFPFFNQFKASDFQEVLLDI